MLHVRRCKSSYLQTPCYIYPIYSPLTLPRIAKERKKASRAVSRVSSRIGRTGRTMYKFEHPSKVRNDRREEKGGEGGKHRFRKHRQAGAW